MPALMGKMKIMEWYLQLAKFDPKWTESRKIFRAMCYLMKILK